MMEYIVIEDGEDLWCPFCKKLLITEEAKDVWTCEHTLYVATDNGFEYCREDFEHDIDERLIDYMDFDSYTADLPIEGIRKTIHSNWGPTSFVSYGFVKTVLDKSK